MAVNTIGTEKSLLTGLIGDGRPALATVAVSIALAGGLAVYLGATRQLLPHDLAYLGVSAAEIDAIANGGLMDFMVHDRVSWGGSLFAVGLLSMWLVAFPMAEARRWAWSPLRQRGWLVLRPSCPTSRPAISTVGMAWGHRAGCSRHRFDLWTNSERVA